MIYDFYDGENDRIKKPYSEGTLTVKVNKLFTITYYNNAYTFFFLIFSWAGPGTSALLIFLGIARNACWCKTFYQEICMVL